MLLTWVHALPLVLIGILSGTLAGLFGIGGGTIVVTGLMFWYKSPYHGHVVASMHTAAATSLAVMIATTLLSFMAHQRHQQIQWRALFPILAISLPFVVIGALLSVHLSSLILERLFASILILIGAHMLISQRHKNQATNKAPRPFKIALLFSPLVGLLSGMLGLGGGVLTVPLLTAVNFPIKKAIGTSAALTFFIAIVGTLSYTFLPQWLEHLPHQMAFKLIDGKAFMMIAPVSMLCAIIGAKITQRSDHHRIKIGFAALLIVIGVVTWL